MFYFGMEFNLADLFEAVVDRVPDQVALVIDNDEYTFSQLDERMNRLANALAARGIGAGDHVGILAYNGHEWIEALFGCYKLGATPININYRYVADELRYIFENAQLKALIYQAEFEPKVAEALEAPMVLVRSQDDSNTAASLDSQDYESIMSASSSQRNFAPRSPDQLYMLYTGGTTGMPKGVMWRHEDVFFTLGGGFDIEGNALKTPEESADRATNGLQLSYLVLPPLMHGAGQWGVQTGILQGFKIVLTRAKSFDADLVWDIVQKQKINILNITGDAMARPMLDRLIARHESLDVSSLISIASSAAIFSQSIKDEYLDIMPNVMIIDSVGATETGLTGVAMVAKGDEMKGGPTIKPGAEAIVLDDDFNVVQPGSGVIGRIARSGHVPLGYFKDPEKTETTFPVVNGVRYVIPGDFALVEDDGSITLLGRGSMCINTGGEKVFPEEVEGALKAHSGVYDALVVGVPDDRFGQRVAAVVSFRQGATATLDELAEHCRGHVAGYKVPRELHVVDSVPRLVNMKPDYKTARQIALSGQTTPA